MWQRFRELSAPEDMKKHWKISILYDDNGRDGSSSHDQEQIFESILLWVKSSPSASTDLLLQILIIMILLFSDEEGSLELEQPTLVRAIQNRYLTTLFRYGYHHDMLL